MAEQLSPGGEFYSQPLPFSLEAEQSVLGAAIIDPGRIPEIMEYVKPEYFYRRQHSDLYALLGNILDNAVAAAEKEPDPARRYIRLEIARRRGMVLVHCENNCIPANLPEVRDGMPLPDSRRGQGPHGFGLQTIRSIAENYGGYCRVGAGDGRFELNLLFPQGEKTQFGAEK